jgi:hypothetical protein
MLDSIERTARVAGVSLDSIDLGDKAPWGGKHLHRRAQAVGFGGAYDAMFGGLSHNVHGSWQDLYDYHLKVEDEERFTPALKWRRPRPQLLFALGTIVLEVTYEVLHFMGGEPALSQVGDKLADLDARIRRADDAHEEYFAKPQRRKT